MELGTTLGESHGYGFLRFKFLTSLSSAIFFNALIKLKKIQQQSIWMILSIKMITALHLKMIQMISIPLTFHNWSTKFWIFIIENQANFKISGGLRYAENAFLN